MAQDSNSDVDACPVDHTARTAWLQSQTPRSQTPSREATFPPHSIFVSQEELLQNHELRLLRLIKATAVPIPEDQIKQLRQTAPAQPRYLLRTCPVQYPPLSPLSRLFWTSNVESPTPHRTSSPIAKALVKSIIHRKSSQSHNKAGGLSQEREISSIPRGTFNTPPGLAPLTPSNHETETVPSTSGHWIYPSERQFYDAMARKGHSPQSADMKTIIPIHNAVNERAWREIQDWERPWVSGTEGDGGGSRLVSFMGKGSGEGEGGRRNMSPRARWRMMMGYLPPFDRHDWIVERGMGRRVEYVIDFYSGKAEEGKNHGGAKEREGGLGQGKKLSFYLDVRPKLNTWEGCKMRFMRAVGWV